jgi:hypothetical protein
MENSDFNVMSELIERWKNRSNHLVNSDKGYLHTESNRWMAKSIDQCIDELSFLLVSIYNSNAGK